jgi:hypothetical protein
MQLRPGFVALVFLFCSCTLTGRLDRPADSRANERREEIQEELRRARQDQPDDALRYAAMKREGSEDPQRSLELAWTKMQSMPRYSSVDDRSVDPRSRTLIADSVLTPQSSSLPLATWNFLGPGNIGGRTRVLVIDPTDPSVMYAAAVSGGVWKTTDGGANWTGTGDLLTNLTVNSLVMDPADPLTLYAGTGEGFFREEVRGTALPLRGNGIFVTHDGGHSWTKLGSTGNENFFWVNDLVISAHDPSRIYAATRTGVWRSRDAGATWSAVLPTSVKGGCLDLALKPKANGDYLFASCGTLTQATVYRNEDASGATPWVSVLSEPGMGRTSLAVSPSRPDVVYAMSASIESGSRYQALLAVYRSDLSGAAGSWTAKVRGTQGDRIGSLILMNPYAATANTCDDKDQNQNVNMGWYCNVIAVDPVDENRVWAAGVDLFRSDDGGSTWGLASYWWEDSDTASFAHADHHGITFHPAYDGVTNRTMFTACDGGVFRTDNATDAVARTFDAPCDSSASGIAFRSLNHSYGATQFYHGAVSPNGRTFFAGAQDNGTVRGTIDGGINGWKMVYGGDGGYSAIDPVDPNVVYVEYQGAQIRRSANGGTVFFLANNGLQDNFLFITPFVLDTSDTRRLWTGGTRLWRSDDRGSNWKIASTQVGGLVSAIAIAPGDGNRVLAGSSTGDIVRNDAATLASTATTWATVSPRSGFVSSLAFDPTNRDIAYATYAGFGGSHVWRSIDAGATWTSIDGIGTGKLPDMPVHSIAVDPSRPSRLFLGTDLGVFVSTDSGATWQVENTGFANVVTEWIVVGQGVRGPAIYAFTHGRGAWKAELVAPVRRRSAGR